MTVTRSAFTGARDIQRALYAFSTGLSAVLHMERPTSQTCVQAQPPILLRRRSGQDTVAAVVQHAVRSGA